MDKRYADVDKLKKEMIQTLNALQENPRMKGQEVHLICAFHTVGVMVDDLATTNVVEVVRCKDCAKCDIGNEKYSWCHEHKRNVVADSCYCFWGQRRRKDE